MALFGNLITEQLVIAHAVNIFSALRTAMHDAQSFYLWVSAQSDADLEALGFSSGDVSTLKSAAADANELAVLYTGGSLGSYTLPYNFSASQRLVIGPQ